MPASEQILTKIKLLLKLKESPSIHESEAAASMAANLIDKYGVTIEELEGIKDKPPVYSTDDSLFTVVGIVGWKSQLALAIAVKLDCYIIQEECVPVEGEHIYNYYVYGSNDDAKAVKLYYHSLSSKIENLIIKNCKGRGQIYISSYAEGLVQAVKQNLEYEDFIVVKTLTKDPNPDSSTLNSGGSTLTTQVKGKEKPIQESVDVNSHSLIKDIGAYFRGIADGQRISIEDIFELNSNQQYQLT